MISSCRETDMHAVTENPASVTLRNCRVTQIHLADGMCVLDLDKQNKSNNGSQRNSATINVSV